MATYETVNEQGPDFKVTTLMESDTNAPLHIKTRTEFIDGTLGISKGGTGINTLEGKRLIASNIDGTSLEEIDVGLEYFSGLRTNIQDKLDSIRSFSVDVTVDDWNTDSDGYYKEITVNDIKSTDNPIIGLTTKSTSVDGVESEKYAYSCIDKVTVLDNKVIFRCFEEIPTVDISLIFVCV